MAAATVHIDNMALFRIFLICLIAANFPGTSTFTPVISPFDISIYNNTCISTDNNVTTLDCDACTDFYVIVKTAMLYACTRDEEAANKTVELITEYETKWYPGRTYGIVMSLNTVKLIKQMTNLYSYIDIYRGYRYSAVSKFRTNRTTRLNSTLLLAGLWSIVVLYAVPAIIFAKTEQEYCKYAEDVFLYHASVELAVMCIFPVVLVSVFSTMASIRLKKSAENIPGEKMGQEKRIRDRIITSRVLIGLVVIFVSTYLPKYLFDVLITVDQSVRNTYDYR
ncbi:hypothetical protein L9F63_023178, partial [Diploptera punctata]